MLATANFYNYIKYKNGRSLYLCIAILITFAAIVTRKMIIVSSLQIVVVYYLLGGGIRLKSISLVLLSVVVVSVIFGVIGDIRTGRELFLSLSRPSFEYPDWLPSGLMWVYIYMVTPILNLTNAIYTVNIDKTNLDFICQLLPSVVRYSSGCVVEEVSQFDKAYQLSGAFNVATGYISIYLSQDKFGVIIFSFLHGIFCAFIYNTLNGRMRSVMLFSIVTQINLLMIFGNGFLNLNVVSQIPMILMFFPSKFRIGHSRKEAI
jgi:oligosaccharide repeat unit polymerase